MRYTIQVEKDGVNLGKLVNQKVVLQRAKNLRKKLWREAAKDGFQLVIVPA